MNPDSQGHENDEVREVPTQEPVRWQAPEYIQRQKSMTWFVVFGAIIIALMALAYFVLHSWTFALVIFVMALAVIVYAVRSPRIIQYSVSPQGIYMNDRLYAMANFKSFSIHRDDEGYVIQLVPTKRLGVGMTLHFPSEIHDSLIAMVGQALPNDERDLDPVDKVIKKIHL